MTKLNDYQTQPWLNTTLTILTLYTIIKNIKNHTII